MPYKNEGTPEIRHALRLIRDNDVRGPRDMAKLLSPGYSWGERMPAEEEMELIGDVALSKLKTQGFLLFGFPKSRIILSDKGRKAIGE